MVERDFEADIDIDIKLNAFVRSDEWLHILEILKLAEDDHLAICCDSSKGIEAIRFSQGALAAIASFRELPNQMFGVKDNGRNTK